MMNRPITESCALLKINKWSKYKEKWQQDALRRLFEQENLTDKDYEALLKIARGEDEDKATPFQYENKRAPFQNQVVNLKSITDVKNVNALASGQKLSFNQGNGMTVIYGDNGSGKSGYARILKKVCRARYKQNIKPCIYAKNPGQPTATITFFVGSEKKEEKWIQNENHHSPILDSVSIFDSQAANVHVDSENNVAYTPFPIKLLSRLTTVCDAFKAYIEKKINNLGQQIPDSVYNSKCKDDTEVGKIVRNLNANSFHYGEEEKRAIKRLATLSDKEDKQYKTLESDIQADSNERARTLETLKSNCQEGIDALNEAITACSDENLKDIQNKKKDYEAKRKAAQAAAKAISSGEVLPKLEENTWRNLWEAARAYAKHDDPEKQFPYTGSDAQCVLCQQYLSEDAKKRFNLFEQFVEGEFKKSEESALASYQGKLNSLKQHENALEGVGKNLEPLNTNDQIKNPELAKSFENLIDQIRKRIQAFLNEQSSTIESLPRIAAMPVYQPVLAALQNRIDALRAAENSPEQKAMQQKFDELKDRMWLGNHKNDVLEAIDCRIEIQKLKTIQKTTNTQDITKKSDELVKDLVTDALCNRFQKEIKKLGLGELRIELQRGKPRKGHSRFKVGFTKKGNEQVGEVLSEGEFKCVALAAFLAEQATVENKSAIVFDDPVCSLDHVHRQQVADRLFEIAQEQQVIIFTHDLAFLSTLLEESKTKIELRSIHKSDQSIGLCRESLPLGKKGTGINFIKGALDELEKKLKKDKEKREDWCDRIGYYVQELRILWESAVESVLAPVYKRLERTVKIKGLRQVAVITQQDCKTMSIAYDTLSSRLHSQSEQLNSPMLTPEDIEEQINQIRNWVEEIKNRQKDVDKSCSR